MTDEIRESEAMDVESKEYEMDEAILNDVEIDGASEELADEAVEGAAAEAVEDVNSAEDTAASVEDAGVDAAEGDAEVAEACPRRAAFGALMRVQRLQMMLHHQHMAKRGPMGDPTRGQGRVLALLQVKDGLATRDMANILGIRPSSLNETLSRLEREGLVERRQNEDDKRQQLVFLTDAGRAQDTRPKRPLKGALDGFTDEELAQLTGYLERIASAMEEELGPEAKEHLERGRRKREELFGEGGPGFGPDFGPFGPGPDFGPHGPRGPHGPHGPHGCHGPRGPRPDHGDGPRGPRAPWDPDRIVRG